MAVTQQAVIRRLDELIEIASQTDKSVHDNLVACRRRFAEPSYRIVILGTWNSGKSTLVNAFLGQNLLPTGLVPTTKALLELRHGTQLAALVVKPDDEEVPIRIDDLKSDEKKVLEAGSYFRLRSNSDFLSNGLILVDTPGLQDVDNNAYELTLSEIPKADAILMLFNAGEGGVRRLRARIPGKCRPPKRRQPQVFPCVQQD